MLTTFFATLSLLFGFVAISSFTAHNSVYFMIITFLLTGILYYLISCTYVSIMLFIVYVGAVAMLFVFCVMLLNLQSEGFVGRLQYFFYTVILLGSILVLFNFFSYYYSASLDYFTFFFYDFGFGAFTKDVIFLSSFYTIYTPYIFFLGVLLFFVTVAATVLLG